VIPQIRQAQPEEFDTICDLNVEAYREFAQYLTPEIWQGMQVSLRAVQAVAQRADFLVARLSDDLAGSIAYCPAGSSRDPIPREWASVRLLAVSPRYRGHGIGRLLTIACLDLAHLEKAQTVGLYTSQLMTAARHIYESLGFRQDCEVTPYYGLRYFRYRLELASE